MSTQTTETLIQRVIEIASDQTDLPKEQILLDSQFVADLGFDSLDQVEFVMNAEEEFDITVADEEAEEILTVRQAVQLIQEKLNEDRQI